MLRSATGEIELHHTFDLEGESRALWLSRRENGFHLHLVDGWSGPVALTADSTGACALTVAGRSEPVVALLNLTGFALILATAVVVGWFKSAPWLASAKPFPGEC